MVDYDVTIPANLLSGFLAEPNAVAKLLEAVLDQVLDAQASAPYRK